jgi:phage host-nuclease inhibitor protein Gam
MAREKKVVHKGVTREQMDAAFGEYAIADARLDKIRATIDVQTTTIRGKYADEVNSLQDSMDKNFDIMQAYAVENRDELFTKKKSLECVHGTIGFRTGNPAVKPRKGFKWADVVCLLKDYLPDYLRTTVEPDKDRLLNDRGVEEVAALFGRVGIEIRQDETFYVEPKKEA